MQEAAFEESLEEILKRDTRYQRDAYMFVHDALDHTRKLLNRESRGGARPAKRDRKHVTPQELLRGIQELALETYGPMTITVLTEWGIHSCKDFGEIVFTLVEHNVYAKTETDSRADFEKGFDFEEVFRKPYLPKAQAGARARDEKIPHT